MHRYLDSSTAAGESLQSDGLTRLTRSSAHTARVDSSPFAAAAESVNAVLDSFAAALCVVDGIRQVQLMNRAARDLVAQRDCFAIREGCLYGVASSTTRQLDQALEAALGPDATQKAFRMRDASNQLNLQVNVRALPAGVHGAPRVAPLALITAARSQEIKHEEGTLRSLFGLSHSEAAILSGLLSGMTLEQCAQARGVAVSTARSQLKSIFGKTNTTSQAQLMVVAQTLPVTTAAHSNRFSA